MRKYRHLSRRAFLRAGALATLGLAAGCAPATTPSQDTVEPTAQARATEASTATALPSPTPAASATPTPTAVPTHTPTAAPTQAATALPTNTATAEPAVPASPTAGLATSTPTTAPTFTPTAVPATPTPTAVPPLPTATPLIVTPSRADLLAHFPQTAQSAVAVVQHGGVWSGNDILTNVVLEMLDAAITRLTGMNDALAAWQVLFDPGEVVGLKVNTISRYTTTTQVAYAVAQRLQEAGIPAEQIVIFDRSRRELQDRGFTINDGGPGVQCRDARSWDQEVTVAGTQQRLHDALLSCNALINIPALKEHDTSGFTSALKNHYGTVNSPDSLHGNDCDPAIPELNALPAIRDKTRLVVGDFIRICPYGWERMVPENTIAMSFDPVAHDGVARQILLDRYAADGRSAPHVQAKSHYLETAIQKGLGAGAEHTEVRKHVLG
jgi:hypothetical protein